MDIPDLSPEQPNLAIWKVLPTREIFHDVKNDKRNISVMNNSSTWRSKRMIAAAGQADFEGLLKTSSELYKSCTPALTDRRGNTTPSHAGNKVQKKDASA
jgi:hypothetical protein